MPVGWIHLLLCRAGGVWGSLVGWEVVGWLASEAVRYIGQVLCPQYTAIGVVGHRASPTSTLSLGECRCSVLLGFSYICSVFAFFTPLFRPERTRNQFCLASTLFLLKCRCRRCSKALGWYGLLVWLHLHSGVPLWVGGAPTSEGPRVTHPPWTLCDQYGLSMEPRVTHLVAKVFQQTCNVQSTNLHSKCFFF